MDWGRHSGTGRSGPFAGGLYLHSPLFLLLSIPVGPHIPSDDMSADNL